MKNKKKKGFRVKIDIIVDSDSVKLIQREILYIENDISFIIFS